MKISERITLLKAGYSREEINQMVNEEKAEETAESEKPEVPQDYKDILVNLASEVKTLKEAVQRKNVQQAEAKAPDPQDDVIKILGSLVDPSLKNKEE